MELFIFFLLAGIFGWFVTGIDDLIIFSTIYKRAKDKNKVILGLFAGVFLMIAFSLLIGMNAEYLGKFAIIGAFFPLFLSFKIIYEYIQVNYFKLNLKEETDKLVNNSTSGFTLAFFSYVTNATDDLLFNASIAINKTLFFLLTYFSGIILGVLIMIYLSKRLNNIRDYPLIRALILFLVGIIIFYNGFKTIFP